MVVVVLLNGKSIEMEQIGENKYRAVIAAPEGKVKYTKDMELYPLTVKASIEEETDEQTVQLMVNGCDNRMQAIAAESDGGEVGNVGDEVEIDIDIGGDNDFEMKMPQSSWTEEMYGFENRIYIPDTEYGGLLEDLKVETKSNEVVWHGWTWRGLLTMKVVEPPAGADHLTVSGDLNDVVKQLVGTRFGVLFVVSEEKTGVAVTDWKVDRYVTVYDAIMKLLENHGYRLDIKYKQEEYPENGAVHLKAVKAVDYSGEVEYSRDGKLHFTIRDYRMGINHLICCGKGEDEERIVVHLYVQEDGSIGQNQFYTGLAEREAVYDYNSADQDKLIEDGTKKLKELMNFSSIDLTVEEEFLELGDIVGGYEDITGISVKQPIAQKVLQIKEGTVSIEYKVKGDE